MTVKICASKQNGNRQGVIFRFFGFNLTFCCVKTHCEWGTKSKWILDFEEACDFLAWVIWCVIWKRCKLWIVFISLYDLKMPSNMIINTTIFWQKYVQTIFQFGVAERRTNSGYCIFKKCCGLFIVSKLNITDIFGARAETISN